RRVERERLQFECDRFVVGGDGAEGRNTGNENGGSDETIHWNDPRDVNWRTVICHTPPRTAGQSPISGRRGRSTRPRAVAILPRSKSPAHSRGRAAPRRCRTSATSIAAALEIASSAARSECG